MLYYALIFLVIGLIAGALGLFGVGGNRLSDVLGPVPRRASFF
jgi:hypothetical protein